MRFIVEAPPPMGVIPASSPFDGLYPALNSLAAFTSASSSFWASAWIVDHRVQDFAGLLGGVRAQRRDLGLPALGLPPALERLSFGVPQLRRVLHAAPASWVECCPRG